MILNVGAGGATNADKIKYDNSKSGLESNNVQAAVDELNESFAFVEGTCPTTGDSAVVECGYPSGFNGNNSVVVSVGFCPATGGGWFYNSIKNVTPRVILYDNHITVQNDGVSSTWYGKPFRILLKKIS